MRALEAHCTQDCYYFQAGDCKLQGPIHKIGEKGYLQSEVDCKDSCDGHVSESLNNCTHYEWDNNDKICTLLSIYKESRSADLPECSMVAGVQGLNEEDVKGCLDGRGITHGEY